MTSRKVRRTRTDLRYRLHLPLLAAAIGLILIGYLLLMQPPVDGPLSRTVAPVLLVLGYGVGIPAALLYRSAGVRNRQR